MNSHEIAGAQIEEAIAGVLRAEHEAQMAIEQCRNECVKSVSEARLEVERIARCADRRIARWRAHLHLASERRIDEIARACELEAADSGAERAVNEHLERAVLAVTRELTEVAE